MDKHFNITYLFSIAQDHFKDIPRQIIMESIHNFLEKTPELEPNSKYHFIAKTYASLLKSELELDYNFRERAKDYLYLYNIAVDSDQEEEYNGGV